MRHRVQPRRAGPGEVRREPGPRHPDLGPAQPEPHEGVRAVVEGVRQGRVRGLDAAPGKADLAAMVVEMRRALGEKHVYCAAAVDERHQNRRLRNAHVFRQGDNVEVAVLGRGRSPCEALRHGVGADMEYPARFGC